MVTIGQITWKINDKSIDAIHEMNQHLFSTKEEFQRFLFTPIQPLMSEIVLRFGSGTYIDTKDYYTYDNPTGIRPIDIFGAIYTYYNLPMNLREYHKLRADTTEFFAPELIRGIQKRIDLLGKQIWLLAVVNVFDVYEVLLMDY